MVSLRELLSYSTAYRRALDTSKISFDLLPILTYFRLFSVGDIDTTMRYQLLIRILMPMLITSVGMSFLNPKVG